MNTKISNLEELLTPHILFQANKQRKELSLIEQEHWRQSISWFFLTDMIKNKIRTEIQREMKHKDLGTLILSIILILLQYTQNFLYVNFNKVIDKDKGLITVYIIGKSTPLIEIIRGITSLASLVLFALIIFHYVLKRNLLIFKQHNEISSSFKSKRLLIPMLIELLLSLLHTPPLLNNITITLPTFNSNPSSVPVDINILISILSKLRFYLILKFYFNYSKWGNDRATRICRESNVSHGMIFVLKAKLKDHPFIIIPILYIVSILLFGYVLSSSEMCFIYNIPLRYYNDWTNQFNGIWCIATAMFCLGYGDFNPQTLAGRMLIVLAPIWGLTILSYFFVSLISTTKMSSKQIKVYKEINSLRHKREFRRQGLRLILSYYRLNRVLQIEWHPNSNSNSLNKGIDAKRRKGVYILNKDIRAFKKTKTQLQRLDNEISTEDLLNSINKQVKENMNILVFTSKAEINNLIQHIELSKEIQGKIYSYVKCLLSMNISIMKAIESKDNDKK